MTNQESISAFEMIKIGIGPSSSHTMGPWIAAEMFLDHLVEENTKFQEVQFIEVHLYGSLAKTGKGHGTDLAVLMGLSSEDYRSIDTSRVFSKFNTIIESKKIMLNGYYETSFDYDHQMIFHKEESKPFHANAMTLKAVLKDTTVIEKSYYSLGGGFVATDAINTITTKAIVTPYPCHLAESISKYCNDLNVSVSDLVYLNEQAWRTKEEIDHKAADIWRAIKECIWKGCHTRGVLPGGLEVKRRAADISNHLLNNNTYNDFESWIFAIKSGGNDFTKINKWISCFALAVNEENASFGRIVTAPTNGAAGVIPAVLMYGYCFLDFDIDRIIRFILTAGEIGTIFKKNATISAAMGGCQAEIGVSSAMAAAALTECSEGTPAQVLMAAEIAMEHHLGLTCDPIGGLVQIPCIERNSMGAIKAITASNLALVSDPENARVSLDAVIKTMWDTAKDMNAKYKETSEGGLAANISVNITEC